MSKEIPRVIIPEEKDYTTYFYFVQLYASSEPYIQFGIQGQGGCDKIAINMLEKLGLKININPKNNFPELKGKNYEIVGIGLATKIRNQIFVSNVKDKKLNLGPDEEHFEKVKPFFPKDLTIKLKDSY